MSRQSDKGKATDTYRSNVQDDISDDDFDGESIKEQSCR